MNGSGDGGRRMIVPEVDRENWRWYLFELFCSRPRIQNLIAVDLRPLWHAAVPQDDLLKRARSFTHLGTPRRLATTDPLLLRYVEAVQAAVDRTLRLRQDRRPARWGCIHLHARVEAMAGGGLTDQGKPAAWWPPIRTSRPRPSSRKKSRRRGSVPPWPNCKSRSTRRGGRVTIVQPTGEPEAWVGAGDFMRFEEWEELRRAAYAAVDTQIEWMRRTFEDWYPTNAIRPRTTHGKDDAEALIQHLLDRAPTPAPGADRERLRRFAKYLGVDFPASN